MGAYALTEGRAQLGGDDGYLLAEIDAHGVTVQQEPCDKFCNYSPARFGLTWAEFDALTAFVAQMRRPISTTSTARQMAAE